MVGLLKHIEVVAAVIVSKGKILCVQRGANVRPYVSEKWEFPGGKVEPGEDRASALTREIAEELKISIEVRSLFITVEHSYPDFRITMHAYECAIIDPSRSLVLTEHIAFRWIDPVDAEFRSLDWAEADIPIVNLLRQGGA